MPLPVAFIARMSDTGLKILVVDQNVMRAAIIEEGLRDAGYLNVTVVRDMQNLQQRIATADPEVIFIDLENPNVPSLAHRASSGGDVCRSIRFRRYRSRD
jgi:response regulator NasT